MINRDEELLSSYIDGELSAGLSKDLEQRLAVEPHLQSRLQSMQELNKTLKSTFDTPRARTVPGRIIRLLSKPERQSTSNHSEAGNVVAFPGQRKARWSFAIAASIMAASGLLLFQGTGPQLADHMSGADSLLAQELQSAPSRAEGWDTLADGRQVRPLLSYAHIDGGWCREYLLQDRGHNIRSVACQTGTRGWVIQVSDSQPISSSTDEYRTASAEDSDVIAKFMASSAADIALSAKREEELIATGWR